MGLVEPPIITPDGGQALSGPVEVTIDFGLGTHFGSAVIRVTTDGSEPTGTSDQVFPGNTFTVTESTVIQAKTFMRFEPLSSDKAIAAFVFADAEGGVVQFDPPAGSYVHSVTIDLVVELPEEGGLHDPIIIYNLDQAADPTIETGNPTNTSFYLGNTFTLSIGQGGEQMVKARLYGTDDEGQVAYGPVSTAFYRFTP